MPKNMTIHLKIQNNYTRQVFINYCVQQWRLIFANQVLRVNLSIKPRTMGWTLSSNTNPSTANWKNWESKNGMLRRQFQGSRNVKTQYSTKKLENGALNFWANPPGRVLPLNFFYYRKLRTWVQWISLMHVVASGCLTSKIFVSFILWDPISR